jgi:hypothetical protein
MGAQVLIYQQPTGKDTVKKPASVRTNKNATYWCVADSA